MFKILLEAVAISTFQIAQRSNVEMSPLLVESILYRCVPAYREVLCMGACAYMCTGLYSSLAQLVLPWQLGMPHHLLNGGKVNGFAHWLFISLRGM